MIAPPSTDLRNRLRGLWLPLVTPFDNGAVDETSLRRLVRHYAHRPIDGLILAATFGEGMTLERAELEQIVMLVRSELSGIRRYLPICLGLQPTSLGSRTWRRSTYSHSDRGGCARA